MLKLLIATAPYLLKVPSQKSQKQVVRSLAALALFALSGLMLAAALFIYLTSIYGAAIGFLSMGTLFLTAGLMVFYKKKNPKVANSNSLPATTTSDPIAALIPEAIIRDPAVTKLINQIASKPVATSLAAATIGMLITREVMKD